MIFIKPTKNPLYLTIFHLYVSLILSSISTSNRHTSNCINSNSSNSISINNSTPACTKYWATRRRWRARYHERQHVCPKMWRHWPIETMWARIEMVSPTKMPSRKPITRWRTSFRRNSRRTTTKSWMNWTMWWSISSSSSSRPPKIWHFRRRRIAAITISMRVCKSPRCQCICARWINRNRIFWPAAEAWAMVTVVFEHRTGGIMSSIRRYRVPATVYSSEHCRSRTWMCSQHSNDTIRSHCSTKSTATMVDLPRDCKEIAKKSWRHRCEPITKSCACRSVTFSISMKTILLRIAANRGESIGVTRHAMDSNCNRRCS